MLSYQSVEELCRAAEDSGLPISRVVLSDQARSLEQEEQTLLEQMSARLQVMEVAAEAGMDPSLRSPSGLSGGDAAKMRSYAQSGGIAGSLFSRAIARALATSEYKSLFKIF